MEYSVIVDALRTPFGRLGGGLRDYTAVELAAFAAQSLLTRASFSPDDIDETYFGTGLLASSTVAMARQVNIKAGLRPETPSLTIDRVCCSSMTAIGLADMRIRSGASKAVLAGGVESCSTAPFLQRTTRWGRRLGDYTVEDPLQFRNPLDGVPLSQINGATAIAHGVDREQQDDWAALSHQRYFAAVDRGFFHDEILPMPIKRGKDTGEVQIDESPRRSIDRDRLSRLPVIYGSPTITAGNAPGVNDGASMAILMSASEAARKGFEALCEIVAYVQISGPLNSSAYMPAHAIQKVLKEANVNLADIKHIEINEAAAVMPLVSTKVLADGNAVVLSRLRGITNANGGAVAIGHPPGASGARITMTVARALREIGGGYGIAAVCGGFGQADAILVKV